MPTVFIISEDWTLRTAVRAELLEQGIEALGFECSADALPAAASGPWPDLVIADDSVAAGQAALDSLASRSALLFVASGVHAPANLPGAAVVIRRPARVGEIAARARQILEGQPT